MRERLGQRISPPPPETTPVKPAAPVIDAAENPHALADTVLARLAANTARIVELGMCQRQSWRVARANAGSTVPGYFLRSSQHFLSWRFGVRKVIYDVLTADNGHIYGMNRLQRSIDPAYHEAVKAAIMRANSKGGRGD